MRRMIAMALVGVSGVVWLVADRYGAGRRFWRPYYVALAGGRTHDEVLRDLGPKRRASIQDAAASSGVPYPPPRLTLVGLKQERTLEAWGAAGPGWKRIRSYPVLAASGEAGPKLRQGDLQVPEGVYRLTAFNPNSSYHLSLRVDYPNAEDRAAAAAEGRTQLGGDIFIHGKAVSIGCLAIGDTAIEELYLLVADVGLARTRVVLAPSASPKTRPGSPAWVERLYDRLQRDLRAIRGGAGPS